MIVKGTVLHTIIVRLLSASVPGERWIMGSPINELPTGEQPEIASAKEMEFLAYQFGSTQIFIRSA